MKRRVFTLCLLFVLLTPIMFLSDSNLASAQTGLYYGGNVTVADYPTVQFYVENGSVLYSTGNLNVNLCASIYFPENWQALKNVLYPNLLQTRIYSISYKASWQDKPVQIYQWSINDPANMYDDDPNGTNSVNCNIVLSNVPIGVQHIEVTAAGGGYVANWYTNYFTFSSDSSSSLDFTVNAAPVVSLISPENRTYNSNNVPLIFKVNEVKVNEEYSGLRYSLDNFTDVSVAGNTTLTGLSDGYHNVLVYENDSFGNMVKTATISFNITAETGTKSFPTTLVVTALTLVGIVGAGLLVYFKKHKH